MSMCTKRSRARANAASILRLPRVSATPAEQAKGAVSGGFDPAGNYGFLLRFRKGCQRAQRLGKTLHRDDAKSVRILPRLLRVVPSRDEKRVHTTLARADRLLLQPPDRADPAVEEDLARRCDATAAVDVAAQFLHHLKGERHARRRAAHVAGVDPHP